ncbi:uncharacterized protein LOC131669434 [Phymastichus coffea]|uniref:uncharacterized protein LOC131669434 n=1 Tax=Phymastichus coffea TaxID=108790 RepID=UPI00273C37AE|nr:uncharacterized protein LOC131669434 [Phymastichus coffea]
MHANMNENNLNAINMDENNVNNNHEGEDQFQKYVLTDNAGYEELIDKDKTTEIIGFVEEISAPRDVGKQNQFRLFKFVLSNGERKVSCCVWQKEIIVKYEPEIQINKVVHIIGGLTKVQGEKYAKKVSDGYVPFEIIIQPSTEIEYLGFHNLQEKVTSSRYLEI